MIKFRTVGDSIEMRLLHPRLAEIVTWLVDGGTWSAITGTRDAIVTEVWRSRQQTVAIYEAAGLAPPAASVHEAIKTVGNPLSGCRGIDFSARDGDRGAILGLPYEHWPMLSTERLKALETRINAIWQYNAADDKQVALVHSVSGVHLHLQVRPDAETRRRTVA